MKENKAQILIKGGNIYYEFCKSVTGQLDYKGIVQTAEEIDVSGYQEIYSSAYFSPSYYVYLDKTLCSPYIIYVRDDVDISDTDVYDYLLHIGPLLGSVMVKDSLLAGELYLRRRNVFDKFSQLTQYILSELCVEILFSLCYGRMQLTESESIPLIFNSAAKKLNFNPSIETLDVAFTRYFKEHSTTLTLSVVGKSYHNWSPFCDALSNLDSNFNPDDIFYYAEKVKKAKEEVYSSLSCSVQAEPYNPADKNAIAVLIEDVDSKLTGISGMVKAGYIRAMAAKIIRNAKLTKLSYNGSITRISFNDCVVKITV